MAVWILQWPGWDEVWGERGLLGTMPCKREEEAELPCRPGKLPGTQGLWSEGFQCPMLAEVADPSIPLAQSLNVGPPGKCMTSCKWLSAAVVAKELLARDRLLTTLPPLGGRSLRRDQALTHGALLAIINNTYILYTYIIIFIWLMKNGGKMGCLRSHG